MLRHFQKIITNNQLCVINDKLHASISLLRLVSIQGLRTSYNERNNVLLEENIAVKEPMNLFHQWLQEAIKNKDIIEPTSACLATATKDGIPSARFVLCKGYDRNGFKFFTHYTSRKGQEIAENPNVALTFFWAAHSRSVRVEGVAEKLSFKDADEYFSKRPYQSQIGALASDQSKPIEGRHILWERETELKKKYSEGDVPRPEQWGGYIVRPKSIEFWQGQTDRIHDRIKFRRPKDGEEPDNNLSFQGEGNWIYERLCP